MSRLVDAEMNKLNIFRAISETASVYASQHMGMVAMAIRYKGSQVYADVAVAAGGDLTLSHGASVGAKVADSTLGSPSLNGVFDLSTPAAAVNTYGELADLINASSNWECVLIDVARNWVTDNTLITLSANAGVQQPEGLKLLCDPAEAEVLEAGTPRILAVSLGYEWEHRYNLSFDDRRSTPIVRTGANQGVWRKQNRCTGVVGNTTFGSGAVTLEFWTEAPNGDLTQIAAGIPTAATTVGFNWPSIGAGPQYVEAPPGHRLFAVLRSSAADITAASVSFFGNAIKRGEVQVAR